MTPDAPIFVAGHRGMVGSALVRALARRGFRESAAARACRARSDCQAAVDQFFAAARPRYVFLAALASGAYSPTTAIPRNFCGDNLTIQSNVIDAAYRSGVAKLLFLGSSCVYPKLAPQPITEDSLLTGALERRTSGTRSPRLRESRCA